MDAFWAMVGWVLNLPWLKLAYSALLLALASVVLLELGSLWTRQPVMIGGFTYYADGAEDAGRALGLRTQIRHQHSLVNHRLRAEAERRAREAAEVEAEDAAWRRDTAWLPDGRFEIGAAADALRDLELTVQGVNLSKVTATLRRAVVDPDEIAGTVSRQKEAVDAVVTWPKAPLPAGGLPDARMFPVMGPLNDTSVAFEIACSVIWAETAADPSSKLARVPRADFCAWAGAWSDYFDIRGRRESGHPLTAPDLDGLKAARELMDVLIGRDTAFPEAYRLRAEIIDLLPDAADADRTQAIADLQTYRDLLAGRSLQEIRLVEAPAAVRGATDATLRDGLEALARQGSNPALWVESGKLAGLAAAAPATPAGREIAAVEATLASVGFLRNRRLKHPFSGTGFVIAPDIVATASFVVGTEGGSGFPDVAAGQIDFVLAERIGAPEARVFAVSEVVANIPGSLVLLRVPGLAAAGVRHAELAAVDPATGAAVGVAGFVGGPDAKQLNLGEILPPAPEDEGSGAGVLRYNAQTGAGTSGAPVLSLSDGRVVGVHMAVNRATGEGLGLALPSVIDRLAAAGVPTP